MKVLHVIGSLENGGAEAVLYRIATYPSAFEHCIVSLGRPGWYSEILANDGVKVDHLAAETLWGKIRAFDRLMTIARNSRADVIQGWMYRGNIVGGIVGRLTGQPVVWGVHCSSQDTLSFSTRKWVYASAALVRWIPALIINCSTRSREIHRTYGYETVPGEIINNGYDTNVFFPEKEGRERVRAELGIDNDTFLIGTVARWHMQKDQPNLVRALAILRDRGISGWRCLFVGPQMDRDNATLMRVVNDHDLASKILSIGPRRDIPNIMRALDLHVLPSAGSEAFPNVVAEAMSSGTPCVVTDIGDASYMIGATGWTVPPRAPAELADAIEQALTEFREDRAGWEARELSARARVVEKFTIAPMTRRYEAAWRKVMR